MLPSVERRALAAKSYLPQGPRFSWSPHIRSRGARIINLPREFAARHVKAFAEALWIPASIGNQGPNTSALFDVAIRCSYPEVASVARRSRWARDMSRGSHFRMGSTGPVIASQFFSFPVAIGWAICAHCCRAPGGTAHRRVGSRQRAPGIGAWLRSSPGRPQGILCIGRGRTASSRLRSGDRIPLWAEAFPRWFPPTRGMRRRPRPPDLARHRRDAGFPLCSGIPDEGSRWGDALVGWLVVPSFSFW